MNSTTSSRKLIEKVSSDNQVLGFDLFSSLTYMAILSRGGVGRDRLLEYCSRQRYATSIFFEYIHLMARSMGMEYTRAFQEVAQRTRASRIKSLLLRFSSSISSGGNEMDFILQEARAETENYSNDYERNVENLRKWTDAYAAILVAVTLIMVVSQISSLLGATNQSFIYLMLFTLIGVTSIGVYLIYKVAPYEKVTYDPVVGGTTKTRERGRFFFVVLGSTGFALAVLAFVAISASGTSPIQAASVGFTIFGLFLTPSGYFAWRDANTVSKIDHELPMFLRAIGSTAGSAGVTLTEALKRIDTKSLSELRIHVERLRARLEAQLSSSESWETFSKETGSELASRTTRMFVDGVEVGCEPGQIGELCSDYAQNVTELRAKRQLTASTFSFLTLAMHGTMALILVFVLEVIRNFNLRLTEVMEGGSGEVTASFEMPSGVQAPAGISIPRETEISAGLDVFAISDLTPIMYTIVIAIGILTVANAIAPKFAEGGHNLKIVTYMSITSLISGIVLFVIPKVTTALLSI